jgi:hypothetical protein
MAATFEPIATTTLSSTASSITFSSIPGTYTDLRLVLVGKNGVGSNTTRLRFNSDTGTNYSRTYLEGDGSAAASSRNTSGTSILVGDNRTTIGLQTMDIFSYAGSTNKTVLCSTANDTNGAGTVNVTVGLWRNTNAITSIELSLADPFSIGTVATVYGILKA